MIYSLNTAQRVMYLTSKLEDQIETVFDVYIVGQVTTPYTDLTVSSDVISSSTKIESKYDNLKTYEARILPFKFEIGRNYNDVFNTPPEIDWLPDSIEIWAGEEYT